MPDAKFERAAATSAESLSYGCGEQDRHCVETANPWLAAAFLQGSLSSDAMKVFPRHA